MRATIPAAGPAVLVTAVGAAEGSRAAAAALACAGADLDRATLLVDVGGRPPRPTLLASAAAQRLEERLSSHLPAAHLAARGQVCHLAVAAEEEGLEVAAAAATVARDELRVLHLAPPSLQPLLAAPLGISCTGALLRADLSSGADRSLLALTVGDLHRRDLSVAVLKKRLPWVIERRALFGALAAGAAGGLPVSVQRKLLPESCCRDRDDLETQHATAASAQRRSQADTGTP